jgi:8-amino-7-oxononanoate synthase
LESSGLKRSLRPPKGIDLASNDYLGLAMHPLLRKQMAEAVTREGCGSTGSRLLRGERDSFAELERRFAEFKGYERSIYLSSGYLANLAVLTTVTDSGDVIFSSRQSHC